MTRTLTILAVIATVAVSAQAASAGISSKPSTQTRTYTLNNTMVSGYAVKRSIVVTKATDVSSVRATSKVNGGSNGIIAVLIGAVSAASDGTSNTVAFAERSSGNTMISGSGVSNSRQGLLYNGHAGLGANTVGASRSGPAGAVAAASQGIIMRDGGVCDPIRHMGC
jgi:hypothetical protein